MHVSIGYETLVNYLQTREVLLFVLYHADSGRHGNHPDRYRWAFPRQRSRCPHSGREIHNWLKKDRFVFLKHENKKLNKNYQLNSVHVLLGI